MVFAADITSGVVIFTKRTGREHNNAFISRGLPAINTFRPLTNVLYAPGPVLRATLDGGVGVTRTMVWRGSSY